MKVFRLLTGLATCLCWLLPGAARAEDISGTISTTKTIFEDSELVGNVTCVVVDAPCIRIGAPNIRLKLNGFAITGRAEPPANCTTTTSFVPEDGIADVEQPDLAIVGPGVVQKFRRHGVFLSRATRISVKGITSHKNCFSGLLMAAVTDSDIEANVSVNNAIASGPFPCGGNCISSSNNNRIRKNIFSGNGSVAPGPPGPPDRSNDFGVGLVGTSSGNLIEENTIGGNTNGIWINTAATGNTIRENIIAGNPPIQVMELFGTESSPIGADIQNLSPSGANTFEENLCLTYLGAGPAPCPNLPMKINGHQNTHERPSR